MTGDEVGKKKHIPLDIRPLLNRSLQGKGHMEIRALEGKGNARGFRFGGRGEEGL